MNRKGYTEMFDKEDKIEIGTIDFKGYHKKNNIDNNLEIVNYLNLFELKIIY